MPLHLKKKRDGKYVPADDKGKELGKPRSKKKARAQMTAVNLETRRREGKSAPPRPAKKKRRSKR